MPDEARAPSDDSGASLPEPYLGLAGRLGRPLLQKRLLAQASHWARLDHQGAGIFALERLFPLDPLVRLFLVATGLYRRAYRNHLAPVVARRFWRLRRLPAEFDGLRLLQLTDLHLDLDPALLDALKPRIQSVCCDAIVITGDFRNSTRENFHPAMELTRRLVSFLPDVPKFGILGNHDFIEQAPAIEETGVRLLLNEAAFVGRGESRLWIAGVDDPHFYKTHDLAAAARGIPEEECAILLAHSPEIADELPAGRFDLVLCGHTHGGQLCLPGGIPLHVPVRNQPRERIRGAWTAPDGTTQGYTSPGTGSCGVPARLNCPGEITLHILGR